MASTVTPPLDGVKPTSSSVSMVQKWTLDREAVVRPRSGRPPQSGGTIFFSKGGVHDISLESEIHDISLITVDRGSTIYRLNTCGPPPEKKVFSPHSLNSPCSPGIRQYVGPLIIDPWTHSPAHWPIDHGSIEKNHKVILSPFLET